MNGFFLFIVAVFSCGLASLAFTPLNFALHRCSVVTRNDASLSMSSYRGGDWQRGGGRRGRGRSSGKRGFRPPMDPAAQLNFKKTVKIDPDFRTPVDEMNLSAKTTAVLKKKGFKEMTPVQSQSYENVYSGDDVVARSRTGTGKTFAFGLPLIERIVEQGLNERQRGADGLPLILILEPTRELALQVAQELGSVCAAHRMRVQAIFGGVSFSMQERAVRQGAHVLVATPGRMLDHLSRGTIKLNHIRHVVLDEGDTMLEMGFQKAVESILMNVKAPGEEARKAAATALADDEDDWDDWDDDEDDDDDDMFENFADFDDDDDEDSANSNAPMPVQMLLYSATMPGWICQLTDKLMHEPIFLDAVQEGETRLADTIKHTKVRLPNTRDRMKGVTSYLEDLILTEGKGGQTIIFTNTKDEADNLVGSNCFGQFKSQVLHGDIGQNSRQATIRQFKEGTIDILVATDVAARGLDIAGVDLVVHTGPPNDPDTYVHRSGRTGRAGRNGTSIMLFSSDEERKLFMFERQLNFKFLRSGPPSPQQISEASAVFATKRLDQVNPEVLPYFVPFAQELIRSSNEGKLFDVASELGEFGATEEPSALVMSDEEKNARTMEQVEVLLARCLAAISNRHTIATRSLLTGQEEYMTLQVEAVFRNGSSPSNYRDWQRLIAGVFRRHLMLDDFNFGKMGMGRVPNSQNLFALVDVNSEKAEEVLQIIEKTPLPAGVKITACSTLPDLIPDENDYRSGSYGRRDGGRWDRGRGGRRGGGGGGSDYNRRGGRGAWSPGGGGGRSGSRSGGARKSWTGTQRGY